MTASIKQIISIWLLILCGLSNARSVPRALALGHQAVSDPFHGYLISRQDSEACLQDLTDPDAPTCVYICSPSSDSCAGGSPSKRDLTVESVFQVASNESSQIRRHHDHDGAGRLVKRAFVEVTQGQIPTYLPNQYNGQYDEYFQLPIALVDDDNDNTVVVQRTFGDQPFAVGSWLLHGCTMITVVSSQAVYIGHFWEKPAWTKRETGGPNEFTERIINFFKGGQTFGVGPVIDPALFPPNDPNTRLYVMTPRKTTTAAYTSTNYRGKVPMVVQAVKDALNYQAIPIALYNYKRLNYKMGDGSQDEVLARNSQRGIAHFQYDPNGHGDGQKGWRLFYEHNVFHDTDPPPRSPNGIPDPPAADEASTS